jgi:hypothetical protein
MLVTPVQGCDREQLLKTLREVHTDLHNLRVAAIAEEQRLTEYLYWVDKSIRLLRLQVAAEDLDRLILTKRYWALQTTPPTGFLGTLIDTELMLRDSDLEQAINDLDTQLRRWAGHDHIVVADTSVFCQHPDKLEDIDFAGMLGAREAQIRLVLPILVLDELDALKQAGRSHVRWRAGYTLAKLDTILNAAGNGILHEGDYSPLDHGGIPRGPVTVEILFDPPGHVRLPINDDELIDRALAIQAVSNGPLTFITFDTGQSTRARTAGLKVEKLSIEPGPEPATDD